MAQNGEQVFKLHKLDDRQAYQILTDIRELLNSPSPIQVVPVRNYVFDENEFEIENLRTGEYSILEMRWSGTCRDNNQHIRAKFKRSPESEGNEPSPYFDYVTIGFDGDYGKWKHHSGIIREILKIVSSRDTPAVHVDTGSSPDVLRELILSNNASHRQMMDELNKSVKEMIEKRAQLEVDAKNSETERRLAHEEVRCP
ncbi:MAG: hypothetical protein CML17_13760 [Pusillimonas sp.]|nr:hypothetical protein [Pusillimonas sp.]|tara:strand:+ start:479 stop:1075 length:597 start_codon:yes stop_codon:yes gene_type:complete